MAGHSYETIKKRLAPCGLHCGKCFAFAEGDIQNLSGRLEEALGNFDVYAQRFVGMLGEPVFLKYPDFKEFLHYLSVVKCKGCRAEKCKLFKACKVRLCCEEKKVDFCFQCPEFPCRHTGFDEHLYKRYVGISERIKEIGIEKYYEKVKSLSRY